MRRIGIMLLTILLCGCTAPQNVPAPQPSITPQITPGPTPEPEEFSFLNDSLDPLGIFSDTELYEKPVETLAAEFQAQPREIPGLYRIYDVNTGGYPAKLRIWTEDGKIAQVATVESLSIHYGQIYEQMREFYGAPSAFYQYDNTWYPYPVDTFDETENTIALWEFEDYTAMLASTWTGYAGQGMVIAAFRNGRYDDPLSILEEGQASYWYDPAQDLGMKHGEVIDFDPTGIYRDPALFSANAGTIRKRYHAEPAYENVEYEYYVGQQDPVYLVSGISVAGYPAELVILSDEGGKKAYSVAYQIKGITAGDGDTDVYRGLIAAYMEALGRSSDSFYAENGYRSETWALPNGMTALELVHDGGEIAVSCVPDLPQYAVYQVESDADLNGDGLKDIVRAYREEDQQEDFWLSVYLRSGREIVERVERGPLYPENRFRCVDMDGDGMPEIVFPEIGGRSTRGDVNTTIFRLEDNKLAPMPCLETTAFDEAGPGNYAVREQELNDRFQMDLLSKESGEKHTITCPVSEDVQNEIRGREVVFESLSQHLYACDIKETGRDTYGLRLRMDFEAAYVREPDLEHVLISFTGAAHLRYENGAWIVTEETFEPSSIRMTNNNEESPAASNGPTTGMLDVAITYIPAGEPMSLGEAAERLGTAWSSEAAPCASSIEDPGLLTAIGLETESFPDHDRHIVHFYFSDGTSLAYPDIGTLRPNAKVGYGELNGDDSPEIIVLLEIQLQNRDTIEPLYEPYVITRTEGAYTFVELPELSVLDFTLNWSGFETDNEDNLDYAVPPEFIIAQYEHEDEIFARGTVSLDTLMKWGTMRVDDNLPGHFAIGEENGRQYLLIRRYVSGYGGDLKHIANRVDVLAFDGTTAAIKDRMIYLRPVE